MIDSHCHLYLEEFDADIEKVIENAHNNGITKFYLPAIDMAYTDRMHALENKFPGVCIAMTGLHPCSVKENYADEINHIHTQLGLRKYCAIGEAGLDFHWDKTFVKQQYECLEIQIQLALQYNIPLILHTRNATEETIEVIKKYKNTSLTGIFHCYRGSYEQTKKIIDLGFYLGIGGVLTYKNAGLGDTLAQFDLNNIVLETDAPYLSPVPYRGKRNESAYIKTIAEKLAEVKNISLEEVDIITTRNTEKIFGV
jgi:TatD DNase family protein